MFRLQKVRSSKFSASRQWKTDGPAPDALALLEGFTQWGWQAPFGGFRDLYGDKRWAPKSWVMSRKLRTSNFSPQSHQKEKVSSSSWFMADFKFCLRFVISAFMLWMFHIIFEVTDSKWFKYWILRCEYLCSFWDAGSKWFKYLIFTLWLFYGFWDAGSKWLKCLILRCDCFIAFEVLAGII